MWQAIVLLVVGGFLVGGAWSMLTQGKSRPLVFALAVVAVACAAVGIWMLVELQNHPQ